MKRKKSNGGQERQAFFNALITEYGWDRDTTENLRILPVNFIDNFKQDPDLSTLASIVLMDDGGKDGGMSKQTINDAIKPIQENWRGKLKSPVFFEKNKKITGRHRK